MRNLVTVSRNVCNGRCGALFYEALYEFSAECLVSCCVFRIFYVKLFISLETSSLPSFPISCNTQNLQIVEIAFYKNVYFYIDNLIMFNF